MIQCGQRGRPNATSNLSEDDGPDCQQKESHLGRPHKLEKAGDGAQPPPMSTAIQKFGPGLACPSPPFLAGQCAPASARQAATDLSRPPEDLSGAARTLGWGRIVPAFCPSGESRHSVVGLAVVCKVNIDILEDP